MDEVEIYNPRARNSIHAEYIQVKLNNVKISNIMNERSEEGAAIQCIFCRRMIITNSVFSNMRSSKGGAIYITDQRENKLDNNIDKT